VVDREKHALLWISQLLKDHVGVLWCSQCNYMSMLGCRHTGCVVISSQEAIIRLQAVLEEIET